jgi:hypothetical protein
MGLRAGLNAIAKKERSHNKRAKHEFVSNEKPRNFISSFNIVRVIKSREIR